MDRWTPSGAGADFKLQPDPGAAREVQALRHVVRQPREQGARRTPCTRSCRPRGCRGVRPDSSAHRRAACRTTIDQMIAAKIGQETALPSLEVASETTIQVAACPAGRGCYYSTTLSFRNAHVAAADGVQPAQGVHAAVRRRRHARGARRDHAPDAQPARPDLRPHQRRSSASSGPSDRAVLAELPRDRARDRAPRGRRRRSAISRGVDAARSADRRAATTSTSR